MQPWYRSIAPIPTNSISNWVQCESKDLWRSNNGPRPMKSATKILHKVVSRSQLKSKWSLIADPRRKQRPRINSTSSYLSNTWLGSMALSPDPSKAQAPRRKLFRSQATQVHPCNRPACVTSNLTLTSLITQELFPTMAVTTKVLAKAIVVAKANVFLKGLSNISTSSHKSSKVIAWYRVSKSPR